MREAILPIVLAWSALAGACGPGGRSGSGGGDDDGHGEPDGGNGPGSSTGDDGSLDFVYAHTASELYKVDPDTLDITLIGSFTWSNGPDEMTDLAINKDNLMIGLSFTSVYRVDPMTADAHRLSDSGNSFNGLSFVPADSIGQTGDDILVGTRNSDGVVMRIDTATGQFAPIGNMGSYASSGDLCSVKGFGTIQTAAGNGDDTLVTLAPNSFAATAIGNGVGFGGVYGLAFWKHHIFGFTSDGKFITIDPTTGVGTLVRSTFQAWTGAAVRTTAPVLE